MTFGPPVRAAGDPEAIASHHSWSITMRNPFMSRRESALDARSSTKDHSVIAGIDHTRVIRDGEPMWVPTFQVRDLGLARRDRPAVEMAVA